MDVRQLWTPEDQEYCVRIRRQIHRHPELGFELPETSALVRRELTAMGLTWTDRYAPCSVVAYVNPEKEGKTLLIRADMDALPVLEKSGEPFASEIEGRMHACGHDAHTAILLTLGRVLCRIKDQLPCRVMLLFQPSEECEQSGARCMVENGVTEGVDCAVTFHCGNEHPAGYLGVVEGGYCAACDPITLTFHGKTAHATLHWEGVDAVGMALEAWQGLQDIVAQEVGDRPYIFWLGYFHGGTAHNVVSDQCQIKISFRYYDSAFGNAVRTRGIAYLEALAQSKGGSVDIQWKTSAPAVINDPQLARQFAEAARKIAPDNCGLTEAGMGSEDFAWFVTKVPGIATRLGTGNVEKGITALGHTNNYRIDESAFENGVLALAQFVMDMK